jgi:Reverse transcriptase (RNA-dependent DNA polymerase).
MGIVFSKYKKCDGNKCNNYRGIALLSCIYKVLSSIISNRLTDIQKKIIGDYQNGFRPNRAAIDNIHTLRQITKKAYEYNTQTVILSLDFKHTFDSIYIHKMIQILQPQGISNKLIRLIWMTLQDSSKSSYREEQQKVLMLM